MITIQARCQDQVLHVVDAEYGCVLAPNAEAGNICLLNGNPAQVCSMIESLGMTAARFGVHPVAMMNALTSGIMNADRAKFHHRSPDAPADKEE